MRKIDKIIVHCSDSAFGNALLINKWHKERGFNEVGYHWLILNAYPFSVKDDPLHILDGHISPGRAERIAGAHCLGQNEHSLGICLIGKPGPQKKLFEIFTHAQMLNLAALIKNRMHQYGLTASDVYGHYEFESKKTCPGISGNDLRNFLRTGVL